MMTMRRFTALVESYGGTLARWPEDSRADAEALMRQSPAARAAFAEAQRVDQALDDRRRRLDEALWAPGEQGAALARLRAGVSAQIAATAQRRTSVLGSLLPQPDLAVAGHSVLGIRMAFATTGGCAMAAGLWLGWILNTSTAAPAGLMTILQSGPFPGSMW